MNEHIIKKKSGTKSYWLYLHPYVHAAAKQERAILYNTLNGKLLEFKDATMVRLINRLNSDSNLFTVKLEEKEIDVPLKRFIDQIRELYMGDIVDTSIRPNRPIQFKPMLNLQKIFDYMTVGSDKSKMLLHDEVKDYLNVVTLYINDRCPQSCPMCKGASKQFLCCFKTHNAETEISADDVTRLVAETRNSEIYKFNIVGGNIFSHSNLPEIVSILNHAPLTKDYCCHYLNIEDKPGLFDLLRNENNRLNIIVHFPLKRDVFRFGTELSDRYGIKKTYRFVIETGEHIQMAEELISSFQIEDFELMPFYNGGNLDFFKKNVYLDKNSIAEACPTMNQLFSRMVINTSDFKKLTILPGKDVYANLSHPKIGKWGGTGGHILHFVYEEMHNGKSWTRVRKHVVPCKSCVFNALCPPISNYEYAIGSYDLCYAR